MTDEEETELKTNSRIGEVLYETGKNKLSNIAQKNSMSDTSSGHYLHNNAASSEKIWLQPLCIHSTVS